MIAKNKSFTVDIQCNADIEICLHDAQRIAEDFGVSLKQWWKDFEKSSFSTVYNRQGSLFFRMYTSDKNSMDEEGQENKEGRLGYHEVCAEETRSLKIEFLFEDFEI